MHVSKTCLWLSAGATAPLPGELFTQQYKSAAYTIGCTISWLGLFVLGMVFPIVEVSRFQVRSLTCIALALTVLFSPQKHLHGFCFLIFLFFCVSCGLFFKFNVPEIKNRTALQVAAEFQKMHSKQEEPKHTKTDAREPYETKF